MQYTKYTAAMQFLYYNLPSYLEPITTASPSYNRTSHTLTCVSSGGPVNTVTWRRNGADISSSPYQLGQSLVNATTSTYHNLLTTTSGDVEDYIGSFSCTVSNSGGSSTNQALAIDGIMIPPTINIIVVVCFVSRYSGIWR